MRVRYVVAGLLAAGMVAMVQAQPGGGFGRGGGGSPLFLINNKAVQEDLKLGDEQVKKLQAWGEEFRTKIGEIYKDKGVEFGKGGGGKGKGFDPEMLEKMQAANAEVAKVAYQQLGDVLNKDQIARLKQIGRQQMGLSAFSDAETATALKLTDSQKTSIKGMTGDYQKESREIRAEGGKGGKGGFGRPDPETQKKLTKLEKEYMAKTADLLDASQKTTWKELVGAEFDLTKLQGGFGPPRKKD
jgi:hypothetical protein